MLARGVTWIDDWFCHREVAPGIHAIGEVRFHQVNWSYLILGSERALMFDSGTGVRDIWPVIRRLTPLPVTCLPSHLHFDHVGNIHLFDDVALADLPLIRAFDSPQGIQHPGDRFLGEKEGMAWRVFPVKHWFGIDSMVDLGGRQLQIVHTPGHAPEHISLWEPASKTFLAADFIYHGALYGQIAGADLFVYEETARRLMGILPDDTEIFGAHGMAGEDGLHDAPHLQIQDLKDFITVLNRLNKSGHYPPRVEVNQRMYLLTAGHA
jgi:hydroxyacylglutathione hydrolase